MTDVTRNEEARTRADARPESRKQREARPGSGRWSDTGRSLKEGVAYGLVAGVIFAVVQMLAAAGAGLSVFAPFRMFSSVILGADGLQLSPGVALLVGGITHLVLAAIFGVIYGLLNASLPLGTHTSTGTQALFGLVFGAALWLVNFQLIARFAYPWFLDTNQIAQFLIHALAFGLPLGLMYAASERKVLMRPAHGAAGRA